MIPEDERTMPDLSDWTETCVGVPNTNVLKSGNQSGFFAQMALYKS